MKLLSPAGTFLFFNGNTFADIARTFSDYLFAELPHGAGARPPPRSPIMWPVCSTESAWRRFWNPSAKRLISQSAIARALCGVQRGGSRSELIALPESLLRARSLGYEARGNWMIRDSGSGATVSIW